MTHSPPTSSKSDEHPETRTKLNSNLNVQMLNALIAVHFLFAAAALATAVRLCPSTLVSSPLLTLSTGVYLLPILALANFGCHHAIFFSVYP